MAEPLLTEIFGAGATQTATTVTILKADIDIIASATNKAEGLFAAIVKKAKAALTATAYGTNIDQSIKIEDGFPSIAYRQNGTANDPYMQEQVTVSFSKVTTSPGIEPNAY